MGLSRDNLCASIIMIFTCYWSRNAVFMFRASSGFHDNSYCRNSTKNRCKHIRLKGVRLKRPNTASEGRPTPAGTQTSRTGTGSDAIRQILTQEVQQHVKQVALTERGEDKETLCAVAAAKSLARPLRFLGYGVSL